MQTRERHRRATRTTVAFVTLGLVAVTAACAPIDGRSRRAEPAEVTTSHVRPLSPTPAAGTTPYASMWLWENPVHATTDARGRGYAEADVDVVAGFARAHGLSTVHVATPWASGEGPVAAWLDEMSGALHGAGMTVSALGGDPSWLGDPSLAAQWTRDVAAARLVDHVQLSVEPWTRPLWQTDRPKAVAQWHAVMDAVRAELPEGMSLGIDAPAWLASTSSGPHLSLMDGVMSRADSVAIVAFRDVAEGPDGVLALSADARAEAAAAGVPYTIGLETDSPRVTGGPEYTFFDDGAAALEEQAHIIDDALGSDENYQGIAVERFRTWRDLVDPPAERFVGREA